jgi:hypothetical protein
MRTRPESYSLTDGGASMARKASIWPKGGEWPPTCRNHELKLYPIGWEDTGVRDGGLRAEFRKRFAGWQWTSIETFTVPGVPDSEFITPDGIQGWVEFKRTDAWKVTFEPFQPAWIDRRARYGGRVWVAVRRKTTAKKHAGADQLWMVPGRDVLRLSHEGLRTFGFAYQTETQGPASWDWAWVEGLLRSPPSTTLDLARAS